ncbi:MAG TPA: DUF3470 domain-containing protein [Thauera aminoaromatica]|nr:DUF3470 domain-containing protein [Thauera aminoaromatica]
MVEAHAPLPDADAWVKVADKRAWLDTARAGDPDAKA